MALEGPPQDFLQGSSFLNEPNSFASKNRNEYQLKDGMAIRLEQCPEDDAKEPRAIVTRACEVY
jgi:hypothetical protein